MSNLIDIIREICHYNVDLNEEKRIRAAVEDDQREEKIKRGEL
jgi:hypothetical protein